MTFVGPPQLRPALCAHGDLDRHKAPDMRYSYRTGNRFCPFGWQRSSIPTVNAQSTLSQRSSQHYSQRSHKCMKTLHSAMISLI